MFRSLARPAVDNEPEAATFRSLSNLTVQDATEAPGYRTLSSGTLAATAVPSASEEEDAVFASRVREALAKVEMATPTEGAYRSLSSGRVDEASNEIPLPSQMLRRLLRALE